MKRIILHLFIGMACMVSACSEEEVGSQLTTNDAPSDFSLLSPYDGQEGVSLLPTLAWTESIDPERDVIVFELYLDETSGENLLASNFTHNSFTILDSLKPETSYHWKVIATDGDDGRTETGLTTFTTGLHGDWEELSPTPGLLPIRQHTSFVYDDKVWIIGGKSFDIVGAGDNVYRSSDGMEWEQVTTDAGFPERSLHASVVFDGKMWVIAGSSNGFSPNLNDVWHSEDGITWVNTEATGLPQMMEHSAAVYDNKIWIMHESGLYNSTDGISWTSIESATFPASVGSKCLVFNDKMWVIGGRDIVNNKVNDVWYSSDGTNWTQANPSAGFPKRVLHSAVIFDDKMWVMGGLNDSAGALNDTWYSSDGENWYEILTNEKLFPARFYHTSVIYNGGILIIGGINDLTSLSTDEALGDVWKFQKQE